MDPVQEIKEKLDIVDVIRDYIPVHKAGKNFKALCPFHKEKTPSFVISPDRQTWRCFGSCNEGGDLISFVMKYENVEFYEALLSLAEKAGVDIKKSSGSQKQYSVLYDIHDAATTFFIEQYKKNKEAQEYMASRSLHTNTIDSFKIGYAPGESDALFVYLANKGFDARDIERAGLILKTERGTYVDRFRHRIMFPLSNTLGKIVGFSGRILPSHESDKTGKYVNSPQTPLFNKSRILFAIDHAKKSIKEKNRALLLEGQMDVLLAHQEGVTWAIATSGTAVTDDQLDILHGLSDDIVLSFDNDEAGREATEKTIDMAHAHDFSVFTFTPKEGKDVAEYIQKHPKSFKELLEKETRKAFDYMVDKYKNTLSEKKTMRLFIQKANSIKSPVMRGQWIQKLAQKVQIPEHLLFEESEMMRGTTKKPEKKEEPKKKEIEEKLLNTKRERIAFRIALLVLAHPTLQKHFQDIHIDVPERLIPLFDFVLFKKELPEEYKKHKDLIEDIAAYMDMKASLSYTDGEVENVESEILFLKKEIHKAYLAEQKDILRKQIQQLEKKGTDKEKLKKLLQEFDEIIKVTDNER